MLDVEIEKIIPITEVRDSLNKIIDSVTNSEDLYVVTKNGKPAAIIVGVHHLEKLTGIDHKMIIPEDDAAEKDEKTVEVPVKEASDDNLSSAASDTSTTDTTEAKPESTVEDIKEATPEKIEPTNDGLDDLFAPEMPTNEPSVVEPTIAPLPATAPMTEPQIAPAIDEPVPPITPTVTPTVEPAPQVVTPMASQPFPSGGVVNPPVNPIVPAQPPIPPTTNQI